MVFGDFIPMKKKKFDWVAYDAKLEMLGFFVSIFIDNSELRAENMFLRRTMRNAVDSPDELSMVLNLFDGIKG